MYTFSTQAFCLNHPRISFSSSAVICLVLFETCHLLLFSMLNMKYLFVTLALNSLGHSLAIVPQSVEESLVETETSCSHDLEAHNAVVAWPGDSWYALLVTNLMTMHTSAWLTSRQRCRYTHPRDPLHLHALSPLMPTQSTKHEMLSHLGRVLPLDARALELHLLPSKTLPFRTRQP